MIYVLEGQSFASAAEFVAAINKARLANKNKWIAYVGTVAGQSVRIKSYNTGYLQILEVNGLNHAPPMDMNVTGWKESILNAIDKAAA